MRIKKTVLFPVLFLFLSSLPMLAVRVDHKKKSSIGRKKRNQMRRSKGKAKAKEKEIADKKKFDPRVKKEKARSKNGGGNKWKPKKH